jgi:hypothetical protein
VFDGGLLPFLVLFAETDGIFYLSCFKNHLITFSGQHYFIDKNGRGQHENRFQKQLTMEMYYSIRSLLVSISVVEVNRANYHCYSPTLSDR